MIKVHPYFPEFKLHDASKSEKQNFVNFFFSTIGTYILNSCNLSRTLAYFSHKQMWKFFNKKLSYVKFFKHGFLHLNFPFFFFFLT